MLEDFNGNLLEMLFQENFLLRRGGGIDALAGTFHEIEQEGTLGKKGWH